MVEGGAGTQPRGEVVQNFVSPCVDSENSHRLTLSGCSSIGDPRKSMGRTVMLRLAKTSLGSHVGLVSNTLWKGCKSGKPSNGYRLLIHDFNS